MRTYRVEYQGEHLHFGTWIEALNEHYAWQAAKDKHPHFTVLSVVELMPEMEKD